MSLLSRYVWSSLMLPEEFEKTEEQNAPRHH